MKPLRWVTGLLLAYLANQTLDASWKVVVAQFQTNCPRLARALVTAAARRLPRGRRARYLEEWLADLEDCDSSWRAIRVGISIYLRSWVGLRRVYRRDRRRSRSLLTLAFFALILGGLGVAATTFATMDKPVTVSVDGRDMHVRTFAGDVSGVLRRAGVQLGAGDRVQPGLHAAVRPGTHITVTRSTQSRVTPRASASARAIWMLSAMSWELVLLLMWALFTGPDRVRVPVQTTDAVDPNA